MRYKILASLLMISLLIISAGCSNQDEADRERLDEIAVEVATLFNEEKTDLATDYDSNVLDTIEQLIEGEADGQLNEENEQYLQAIVIDFELAIALIEFEQRVRDLSEQEGDIDAELLATLQKNHEAFTSQNVFYERLKADLVIIEEALEKQLVEQKAVEKAEKAVAKLFTEDAVKDNVTKEAYGAAIKAVEKINDEWLRAELTAQLEKVDAKLKEIAAAEKEKAEREKEKAEAEQEARAKTKTTTTASSKPVSNNSKQQTPSNQGSNKSNASSGSSSNSKSTKPQAKPESKPGKCKEVLLPGNSLGNTGTEFATIEEAIDWGNNNGFDGEAWYDKGYTSWWAQPVFYGCEGQLDIPSGDVVAKTTYTVDFRK